MHIVLFTHPSFLGSQSMPRFGNMLAEGMRARGHTVELWSPKPQASKIAAPKVAKKWLGYVDQYLLFPRWVKHRLKKTPPDTLFVFTDQALGPWIPLVSNRPHIIHCHDFLAQRSALGEISQNSTGWSGRCYQAYIRRGYRQGKHFLSISKATQEDLHRLLGRVPPLSEVIYNGLNAPFIPIERQHALDLVNQYLKTSNAIENKSFSEVQNFILHVGVDNWYKNRLGLLEIYQKVLQKSTTPPLLISVGSSESPELISILTQISQTKEVIFLENIPFEILNALYCSAQLLLFPSHFEGFGWPIAEALACGCPVITTNRAPMTEVGGEVAEYIPPRPEGVESELWAEDAASTVLDLLNDESGIRKSQAEAGMKRAKKFNPDRAIDEYEAAYLRVIREEKI